VGYNPNGSMKVTVVPSSVVLNPPGLYAPDGSIRIAGDLLPPMLKFSKAKAKVRTGSGRGKIAVLGPSTVRGVGSGSDGTGSTSRDQRNVVSRLAETLTSIGIPAEVNSFFGRGDTTSYSSWDSRLSVGTNWTNGAYARGTLGGPTWSHSTADQNPLTFTPAINYDSFDLYHADNGARPDFVISIAGSDVQTVSTTAGTTLIRKVSRTTTLGKSAIGIHKPGSPAASEIAMIGVDCYDSTAPKFSVFNMGWASSTAIDLADPEHILFPLSLPSWQSLNALQVIAPDLTIIMGYGTNEWFLNNTDSVKQAANTPQKFKTAMQSLITASLVSGDVLLTTFHPDGRSATITGGSSQSDFNQIIFDLGRENNIPVIDITTRIGSYTAGNNLGLYYDTVHYNTLGASLEAEIVATVLSSI
jgi:hypothetical protein